MLHHKILQGAVLPTFFAKNLKFVPLIILWLGKRFKGRSIGPVYSTVTSIVYCTLGPKEFPHSSPEAPRTTKARETSTSEVGN
jgi:hypothetical protein